MNYDSLKLKDCPSFPRENDRFILVPDGWGIPLHRICRKYLNANLFINVGFTVSDKFKLQSSLGGEHQEVVKLFLPDVEYIDGACRKYVWDCRYEGCYQNVIKNGCEKFRITYKSDYRYANVRVDIIDHTPFNNNFWNVLDGLVFDKPEFISAQHVKNAFNFVLVT